MREMLKMKNRIAMKQKETVATQFPDGMWLKSDASILSYTICFTTHICREMRSILSVSADLWQPIRARTEHVWYAMRACVPMNLIETRKEKTNRTYISFLAPFNGSMFEEVIPLSFSIVSITRFSCITLMPPPGPADVLLR